MDRVSSLPDELLGHILSFLTTKEAALTSVLSKRWRNLFAFVPNLVFLYPEESQGERHGILQSFMDFVDRVLALQGDSPINKFSLKCKNGVDSERVNQWICNVLQRGVSDLELYSDVEDGTYWRTSEVFRCMTLVELKLGNVVDLRLRNGDCFLPILRTLVLDSVWFYSDQLQLLLSGCPALEELDMADLYWSDSDETVSSASLKTLAFQPNCRLDTLSFDTPHLVYLEYSDFAAKDYPLVNLKNLFEARIILNISDDQSERGRAQNNNLLEDDVILRLGNVWKLISGIRNVHKLYLSADTVEVLSLCCELLPVFNNLKSLCIKSAMDRGWQAMPVLLRNCPHLETLVLEGLLHYETARCGDACDCIYREDKGRSLMSCLLNKIQIKGFRGTVRELNMIENFLKSFPCLKEMEIYAEEDGPTDLEDPGIFELVVKIFILYDKIYSCDVQFLVRGSWFKTWTTAQ